MRRTRKSTEEPHKRVCGVALREAPPKDKTGRIPRGSWKHHQKTRRDEFHEVHEAGNSLPQLFPVFECSFLLYGKFGVRRLGSGRWQATTVSQQDDGWLGRLRRCTGWGESPPAGPTDYGGRLQWRAIWGGAVL